MGLRQSAGRARLRHRPHGRGTHRSWPIQVCGVTVNRNCGSSLTGTSTRPPMSIAAGCEDVQIAGGVEHMQHIPMEAGI